MPFVNFTRFRWIFKNFQVIPQDVVFTKGVSAPQVIAQRVNGLLVDEILSSTSRSNGNVSLHFVDAVFQRDVSVTGGGDCIMIAEMDRSAIKKTGRYKKYKLRNGRERERPVEGNDQISLAGPSRFPSYLEGWSWTYCPLECLRTIHMAYLTFGFVLFYLDFFLFRIIFQY